MVLIKLKTKPDSTSLRKGNVQPNQFNYLFSGSNVYGLLCNKKGI